MFLRSLFLVASAMFFTCTAYSSTLAKELKVAVSIKPLHSLVAHIMNGTSKPQLLIKGKTSPHHGSLKPSQARLIDEADLVIWTGPDLESFLHKPIAARPAGTTLELLKLEGLHFPEKAEEGHHDDADHHEDEKAHHDMDKQAHHDENKNEDNHDHHHHDKDPHIWLDPQNAMVISKQIAMKLAKLDADNKALYEKNAAQLIERLKQQDNKISQNLAPHSALAFLAFHEAYGHFAEHFKLAHYHAVTLNPNDHFGAARIKKLQHLMQEEKINCLFSEPQFSDSALTVIKGERKAFMGQLDPLGSGIDNGPDHYFTLLEDLANSIQQCADFVAAM